MANKYLDHGAYAAYAATPTWGTPQDGDGTATTAATASATVSLDMTGWTFTSGTSTFSVMGCTSLTVGAGANSATNAQYSATLTTMIDNMVAAINQATAAIVNVPAGWQVPAVRNTVFARRTGSNLELMTRTGSASWNTLTAITFANVTGSSPGTWAGGAGGCWGYLFNHLATIWASAVVIGGYGCWGAAKPYAGDMAAGDVVKVRSAKTLTLATNTNVTWTMAAMGTAAAPVTFQIDDSTVWEDGANPVFKITEAFTGNNVMMWSGGTATFAHIKATQYSSGQRNLVLEATGNGPTLTTLRVTAGNVPIKFENIDFYCPGTPSTPASCTASVFLAAGAVTSINTVFLGCRWQWPGHNNVAGAYFVNHNGYSGSVRLTMIGCEFKQTAPTGAQIYALALVSGGAACRFEFDSCVFSGFVTGSGLLPSNALISGSTIAFKNCSLGNVNARGPGVALVASTGFVNDGIFGSTKLGNRDFFLDNRAGFCEWNSSKSYPTLNALLPDGTTPWVIYAVPTTVAANISRVACFELPAINKINSLADGVRTITVELLLESTLSWTKRDISLVFSYVNASGGVVSVDTYDPDAGALTSSSAAWSSVSYNGQTWTKYKFSATTADSVDSGCEVTASIRLHTTATNATTGVFIDPEIGIA